MRKKIILAFLFLALIGCGSEKKDRVPVVGEGEGIARKFIKMQITLPSRAPLESQVPNITTEMNGYFLRLVSTGDNCETPYETEQIGNYRDSDTIFSQLKQNCDHKMYMSFGKRNTSKPGQLTSTITYNDRIRGIMVNHCVRCHVPGQRSPTKTFDSWLQRSARLPASRSWSLDDAPTVLLRWLSPQRPIR